MTAAAVVRLDRIVAVTPILSDPKKAMKIRYDRRSEQMPEPAIEVKHHPSSVNNLVIQQLIERSNHKRLSIFLENELSCVVPSISKRIVTECGWDDNKIVPKNLTSTQITKLVQVLRTVQLFKPPDGTLFFPILFLCVCV